MEVDGGIGDGPAMVDDGSVGDGAAMEVDGGTAGTAAPIGSRERESGSGSGTESESWSGSWTESERWSGSWTESESEGEGQPWVRERVFRWVERTPLNCQATRQTRLGNRKRRVRN